MAAPDFGLAARTPLDVEIFSIPCRATNVMFCFHLGSPESIAAIINRIGPDSKIEPESRPGVKKDKKDKNEEPKTPSKEIVIDPKFLKHLEVGRCVAFVRQPRVLGILKTGYFKFDKHLPYVRRETDAKSTRS